MSEEMKNQTGSERPQRSRSARSMMAAMVLGTALGALGSDARATVADPQAITDINKYCSACWRNARLPEDRWGDCTQEVLIRLLERVEQDRWQSIFAEETSERKEFLRAIDTVKKRTQRSKRFTSLSSDFADHRYEFRNEAGSHLETLNRAAETVLNERQRKILDYIASGWGIPEIAANLETTVERVSDEKYKAIRKLRSHFGISS